MKGRTTPTPTLAPTLLPTIIPLIPAPTLLPTHAPGKFLTKHELHGKLFSGLFNGRTTLFSGLFNGRSNTPQTPATIVLPIDVPTTLPSSTVTLLATRVPCKFLTKNELQKVIIAYLDGTYRG